MSASNPASDVRRIGVGVLVRVIDGAPHLLVTRRPEGVPLAGYWEFPGGKLEDGESSAECVRRELREEVGVDVECAAALPASQHAYAHGMIRLEPWLCRWRGGEPRAIEVAEWRWVRPHELSALRFPPANAELIAELQRRFVGPTLHGAP